MKQEIIQVNGQAYIAHAFVGRKGFKMLTRLSKIVSPVIAELTKGQTGGQELGMGDVDIGAILKQLFVNGTDEVDDLIFDLVADVQKDGMRIDVDKEFMLNYAALVELAIAVAKFNYQDVFQKLGMSSH